MSEPDVLSTRVRWKDQEGNLISEILSDLVDVTQRGDLLWSDAPVEPHAPAAELREFHYETKTECGVWAIHNDDEGQPVLECFACDLEASPLLRVTSELYDLEKLLQLISRQWHEMETAHETRMEKLEVLLGDLRSLSAPDEEEEDTVDEDGAAGLPPEGPVEPVGPGFTPLRNQVVLTEPTQTPADVLAKMEQLAELAGAEETQALTAEEKAAKAEEEYLERSAEVEAEFIEDCEAAEAEGAGGPTESLDSLPGQAPPILPVSPAVPPPDPKESVPPARPTARRRRKKRTRVLDNDTES